MLHNSSCSCPDICWARSCRTSIGNRYDGQAGAFSGKPTVIDLGARTCISCKKMAPILEGLANEYRGKASVLFIDVHEDEAAAKQFRVQMIPTQVFFNGQGKEVKRHIGSMEKADLVKELKAAGLK